MTSRESTRRTAFLALASREFDDPEENADPALGDDRPDNADAYSSRRGAFESTASTSVFAGLAAQEVHQ